MTTLALEHCTVDLDRGVVWYPDGRTASLTAREADLLRFLASRPGETIARDRLMSEVWGVPDGVLSRACDNAVSRLRSKLEGDSSAPFHLLTVQGVGYLFAPSGASEPPEPPITPVAGPTARPLRLGARELDLDRHRVVHPNGTTPLTAQEVAILRVLADADGAVVDRTALARRVIGARSGRALDNAIIRIRAKIEPDRGEPRYLVTERSAGYRLLVDAIPRVRDDPQSFVGRQPELEALRGALGPGRCVIVVGPAGVGKSRLARRVLASLSGPVWWVPLAAATTSDAVCSAIAEVLQLELQGADSAGRIGEALARLGCGTLGLDNLEQVAGPAAELIATWRRLAPDLCLVGTSRSPLGSDEAIVEVPPLPVDDGVELFIERARGRGGSFRARPSTLTELRKLVLRLDGLPLAIELAAARSTVLTPEQLIERFEHVLDLLELPRAADARHRSLRAAFQASFELLDRTEARAFLVLACFRAFELDDAEGLLGVGAIDLLQTLRDHGLVHTRQDAPEGVLRFGVYETLRAFAAEHRRASGDGGEHLETGWVTWLARLGEPSEVDALLDQAPGSAHARRIRAVDDLLQAATVAVAWRQHEAAAACVLAAVGAIGRTRPTGALLSVALEVEAAGPLPDRWAAWLGLAIARVQQGLSRIAEALTHASLAVERARRAGERVCEAHAWAVTAAVQHRMGMLEQWPASLGRAADAYDAAGLRARHAYYRALQQRAFDRDDACNWLREAVSLATASGEQRTAGHAALELAALDLAAGRAGSARRSLDDALTRLHEVQDLVGVFLATYRLLSLLEHSGDLEAHEQVAERGLQAARRRAVRTEEALILAMWAGGRYNCGDLDRAEGLLRQARTALGPLASDEAHISGALDNLDARIHLARGDVRGATHLAERGSSVLERLGVEEAATGLSLLGLCEARLGRTEDGRVRVERAVSMVRDAARPIPLSIALSRLGQVSLLDGDRATAERALAEAAEAAEQAGSSSPRGSAGCEVEALRAALTGDRTAGYPPEPPV
jgi:DNA-binding response OmpR family regulator/tetratricopeptide (TPR) repeat protein